MNEPLDYDSWKTLYGRTHIDPETLAQFKAFHPGVSVYADIERALEREYNEYVTNFWRTNNA